MKVLLISPINRSYVVMPSLGLGYIASVLRENNHEVKILNCIKEKVTFNSFLEYVIKNKYDVYAFQMFSYDLNPVKKHLGIIKRCYPDSVTIVGGYHPSGDPEGVLKCLDHADFGFVSEAEIGFPTLLNELSGRNPDFSIVPNLIYRSGQQYKTNSIKLVEVLDSIPFPAWDLMDPNEYSESPHGGFAKSFPTAPIIITRGCPLKCTFCSGKSITVKVRKRSIENVISEIKYLKQEFGVNDFLIEDENFTLHKPLVKEFCDSVINENVDITWSCPSGVRLDTLTLDMLKLMEKSGCHSLSIGVEFGTQRMHDLTKKGLSLEKIREKMELFKSINIRVTGFFLFGIPGETRDGIMQTIELAKELPISRAQFNNFMPLPGSEIYEDLKKKNYNFDYDSYFVHDVAFVQEGFTRKEMKWFQRRAYLEFYLRPKIAIALIKDITSLRHLYRLIKRFIDAIR